MKKISKENSYDIVLDDRCIAKEYDFKDKDIDFSTTCIHGRYPIRGYCVNEKVKELIYILQGTGSLHI